MKRRLPLIAIVLVVMICCQSVAMACPTCKNAGADDPHRDELVRGYFFSIIFMMSMPFLILAGLSSYFYYQVRRARAHQARFGHLPGHGEPLPAAG